MQQKHLIINRWKSLEKRIKSQSVQIKWNHRMQTHETQETIKLITSHEMPCRTPAKEMRAGSLRISENQVCTEVLKILLAALSATIQMPINTLSSLNQKTALISEPKLASPCNNGQNQYIFIGE